jgi:hypothetical protein
MRLVTLKHSANMPACPLINASHHLAFCKNRYEKEIILSLVGIGAITTYSHARTDALGLGRQIPNRTKYLGVLIDTAGRDVIEIRQRLSSSWQKWNMLTRFWPMSNAFLRVRRIVFKAIICNTLLSDLEAYVLDDHQHDILTRYARKRAKSTCCTQ